MSSACNLNTSSFSLEQNIEIMKSIQSIGSSAIPQCILNKTYDYSDLKSNLDKQRDDLLLNKTDGVKQLSFARSTDLRVPIMTFGDKLKREVVATERFQHVILFSFSPSNDLIENRPQTTSYKTIKDEESLLNFNKAFVPTPLVSLFRSVFPTGSFEEIKSVKEELNIDLSRVNIELRNNNLTCLKNHITVSCFIPRFEDAVTAHMKDHVNSSKYQHPLIFRLIRFVTPSEEHLLNALEDDKMIEPLSHSPDNCIPKPESATTSIAAPEQYSRSDCKYTAGTKVGLTDSHPSETSDEGRAPNMPRPYTALLSDAFSCCFRSKKEN